MNTQNEYDLIVIGAGTAGSAVAKRAAQAGHRVALVERNKLGGTCLNAGCDPTKALLHVAQTHHDMQHAARFGLHAKTITLDWSEVRRHVDGIIDDIRGGSHADAVARQQDRGIDVYLGEAEFCTPHEVYTGTHRLYGARILIATGNTPRVPKLPGLTRERVLTSWDAVKLDELPKRLAILGGGPQGAEFGQMFQRFGVAVTLHEQAPCLLCKDEEELSRRLQRNLEEEGLTILTNTEVTAMEPRAASARLHWKRDGQEGFTDADAVLLAAGRKPAVDALNLDAAGVNYNGNGIETDDTLRTIVPHIWAAGDVVGGAAFTHVASTHARIVYNNMFSTERIAYETEPVPWVTYTDPALAHIGPTAKQLEEAGTAHGVLEMEIEDVIRAKLTDETAGKIKLLVDREGQILAGHILARHADDLIAPVIYAIRHGIGAEEIKDTMLPYPTRAEAIRWTAAKFWPSVVSV